MRSLTQHLNDSQMHAFKAAMDHSISLVKGPPGTGKTQVAVCVLKSWGRPALATSSSNTAVDNLGRGAAKAGLQVLRDGAFGSISPDMREHMVSRLKSERVSQLRQMQTYCVTAVGSLREGSASLSFPSCLFDEAAQATEAATLCAIVHNTWRLCLVGDEKQLPPMVEDEALDVGAGTSLFERLLDSEVITTLLNIQYRMHSGISLWPRMKFYGGSVLDGPHVDERPRLGCVAWPDPTVPVAIIHVDEEYEHDYVTDAGPTSLANEAEARVVGRLVGRLLSRGVRDVGRPHHKKIG